MDKIKIMHVLRPAEGGMKEHVLTLAQHLDRRRYRLVVCGPDYGDIMMRLQRMGVSTFAVNLRGNVNPFADFQALRQLLAVMRQHQVDIVHTHGARAGMVGRIAARRARVPVIVSTFHNFIYGNEHPWWKKNAFAAVQRLLARYTDHVITVSEALGREISRVERYPRDRLSTIYNGLNLNKFNQITDVARKKRELGLDVNLPVVGVVARLIPQKGVSCFLLAARIIQDKIPRVQFLVVGDGPARDSLERQARALGLQRAVFAGFRFDVPRLLPLINVFVIPSLSEGLSIGALEAMAARRPIVATRVGGLPELIRHGKTGMLVPPNDSTALAKTIITILERPFFGEMLGLQARQEVERRFSVEQMVRATEAIYDKLLQQKGYKG